MNRIPTSEPIALQFETRVALTTLEAAFHLNRKQQTLRMWACNENGPLKPRRINGRLFWSTNEIRTLLGERCL